MSRNSFSRVLFFSILIASCVPWASAQDCDFPPKALLQGERREYRGLYENKAYEYSVVIPNELVGYNSKNAFYQTGFGIITGAEPRSYILVESQKNSLEFGSPSEAASRFLKYLAKHGAKLESSEITESKLGQLKAALLVATYTCPGSKERYTEASMVAISPDKGNLYEVTLYAQSDRFEEDRSVFETLAKSWKYLGSS
jgi:hypothetical protein